MAILGVSGSPKKGGNTDRMVQALLGKSGKETEFVNLATLRFDPCRGCVHLCAPTKICGIKDGLHPYLQKVLDAEALVLGTPFFMGTMTGFMFNFLTRLEGFHHVIPALLNKPAILVSAGCKKHEFQISQGIHRFEEMVSHSDQIKPIGHIYYNAQSPPCLRCGEGDHCYIGGLYNYVLDKDKEKLKKFNVSLESVQNWEDSPQVVEEIDIYAKVLEEL
jgi:multimeric flavodoxin WrbA